MSPAWGGGGWVGLLTLQKAASARLEAGCYSAAVPAEEPLRAGLVSFTSGPALIPPPPAGILGTCPPALYCKGKSNIHGTTREYFCMRSAADARRTRTRLLNYRPAARRPPAPDERARGDLGAASTTPVRAEDAFVSLRRSSAAARRGNRAASERRAPRSGRPAS